MIFLNFNFIHLKKCHSDHFQQMANQLTQPKSCWQSAHQTLSTHLFKVGLILCKNNSLSGFNNGTNFILILTFV